MNWFGWFQRSEKLIFTELKNLNFRSFAIMASIEELKDAVTSLTQHITTETGQVSAKLDDLNAQIKVLQDQISAGGAVTPAQLDEVHTMIVAAQSQVDAIIPDAPAAPV